MKSLRQFFKSLFIGQRFYFLLITLVIFYVLAFFFPFLAVPAFVASVLLIVMAALDVVFLFSKQNPLEAKRILPDRFSNGDDNAVKVIAISSYSFVADFKLIDDLPHQFQKRDFYIEGALQPGEALEFDYVLKPVKRGEYHFGDLHFFMRTKLKLIERRVSIEAERMVACYPSYVQMRKYRLLTASNKLMGTGMKQVRRIGHSLEFEQIKEYVNGDDYRNINWRASAKRNNTLFVNNYTDERSQPIYCIINSGRIMKMPFDNMTLLDYAVNASLVVSNTALSKHDKAGLITYGDKWIHILPAERSSLQMNNILHRLYNLQTNFLESDIEKLYYNIKTKITHRSLLLYFTNYETFSSLHRELPYLRMLNKNHFLLVVFFENTELKALLTSIPETVEEVYTKTIAEKFAYEKRLIAKELQQYGILSILTPPQDLTINALNKYLELKARQAV